MAQRRKIEIFTSGCPVCDAAVELVQFLADSEHDIELHDVHDPDAAMLPQNYSSGPPSRAPSERQRLRYRDARGKIWGEC